MSNTEPGDIDKVFKALGHLTRRRILRLLAQNPRYPYELSKLLDLNRRVVLKHLDALQEAGLIEKEHGESDLGPDRTYYRLNVSFGLSTTILPDVFTIRMTRIGSSRVLTIPHGFIVPEARPDIKAVRTLLNELNRVNMKLKGIDEERARFTALRSKIIHKIEDIMVQAQWDRESCQQVRTLLDPINTQKGDEVISTEQDWSLAIKKALTLLEELLQTEK